MIGLCLLGIVGCGEHGKSAGDAGENGGAGGSSSSSNGGSNNGTSGATGSSSGGSSGGGSSDSSNAGSIGATTLATDGNQLSVCKAQVGECNKGYACHLGASPGLGFCSKLCIADSDCDGLAPSGAHYLCGDGAGTQICIIPCQDSMDTSTCPSGMTCQQTGHWRPVARRC
jgi:hypothetical protein